MSRIIFIIFFCFFTFVLIDKSALSKILVSRSFFTMGTVIDFAIVCDDVEPCFRIIQKAHEEVVKLDRIFSNYRRDSELYAVKNSDNRYSIKVSKDFFYLTSMSIFISALTNGAFDITAGSLVDIWKRAVKAGYIPDDLTIKGLKYKCVGIDKLKLISKDESLILKSDCISLDYGAIGKGYALDKISEVLDNEKVQSGIINFGGNIYAKGRNIGDNKWKVYLKIPHSLKNKILVDNIYLSNLSVSTSGGYERYFKIKDKQFSHIVDPRTGYPVDRTKSVTVVSSDAAMGDALSTAFSVMNINEVKKLVEEIDKIGVLIISDTFVYENEYFSRLYKH